MIPCSDSSMMTYGQIGYEIKRNNVLIKNKQMICDFLWRAIAPSTNGWIHAPLQGISCAIISVCLPAMDESGFTFSVSIPFLAPAISTELTSNSNIHYYHFCRGKWVKKRPFLPRIFNLFFSHTIYYLTYLCTHSGPFSSFRLSVFLSFSSLHHLT
jgi:hypothetical protein